MTDRVNWTRLTFLVLVVFTLGCLTGILVIARHGPERVVAAEATVQPARAPSDVRHGTEVDIGPPPEIPEEPATVAKPASAPRATPTPKPKPQREMVYPVPLPAPVAPSPANLPVDEAPADAANPPPAPPIADAVPASADPAAAPAGAAAKAVPRPGPLQPPQRLRKAPPEYPRFARLNNVEGTVLIAATIDTDGKVTYPRVVKSIPILDQAALDAVAKWEFTPGMRAGQPVPVNITLAVEFALR